MTSMPAAAQARLDRVLSSPVRGRSRHDQTRDLARHHVPATDVITKAVAEVEAPDAVGTFEALVSDYGPDRRDERFAPGAFDNAVAKIRRNGRSVPVMFGHAQADANAILGAVPPDGWRIDGEGLHARGWLDTADTVGLKIHRMLKNGALQWSIGFTLVDSRKASRRDQFGMRILDEVDELLELSAVPVPANSRTRTIGVKANNHIPTAAELRAHEIELGLSSAVDSLERNRRMIVPTMDELAAREAALGDLPCIERLTSRRAPTLDAAIERMRTETREQMTRILGGGKAYTRPTTPRDEQRRRATKATQDYELERALNHDTRARS
jgi:HK97 family phage prohead protease